MTAAVEYTPIAVPRIGQATAVEQSRAATEVLASVQAALMFPRDVQRAMAEMRQVCATSYMAERAFYSYRRGGENVSGPTVHLARELARCWGNIHNGIAELSRDDVLGQSEMQAWAWDLQTNERVSTTFIVPHGRDTKDGVKSITDLRSVYENNANNGARRLREMVYSVLPVWFRAEAEEICRRTLNGGGQMTREQQTAFYLDAFSRKSVTQEQVEAFVGRPAESWVQGDLDTLQVVFTEIKNGTKLPEDVFSPPPLTVATVRQQPSGQQWPVQSYTPSTPVQSAPTVNPDSMAPLNPSPVWPIAAQPGTGRRVVREGEAVTVTGPDEYDGGLFPDGGE